MTNKKKSPKGGSKKGAPGRMKPPSSALVAPASPFVIEQMMRGMIPAPRAAKADRKGQAQELFYRAMDAPDDSLMLEMLGQALGLDPHCTDAHLALLEVADGDASQQIAVLRDVIGWAAEELGPTAFDDDRGHFWGLIETRPYMRARAMLAELLTEVGNTDEAIREYEAMLELNPNDNQGNRDPLLALYLETDRLADAARLMEQYAEDASTFRIWAKVLERFLAGDRVGAGQAFWRARQRCQTVEDYLAARKRLPSELPDSYTLGGDDEAMICAVQQAEAWRRHPEAVVWMREQGGGLRGG